MLDGFHRMTKLEQALAILSETHQTIRNSGISVNIHGVAVKIETAINCLVEHAQSETETVPVYVIDEGTKLRIDIWLQIYKVNCRGVEADIGLSDFDRKFPQLKGKNS